MPFELRHRNLLTFYPHPERTVLEHQFIILPPFEQWSNGFNNLRVQRNIVLHSDLILKRFDSEHGFCSPESLAQLANSELHHCRLRWPVSAPKIVNAEYCSALDLLILPRHSARRIWSRILSMSSLVTIRFVICFLTLIRRGLSRNSSNERYCKSRCILAKYFRKATANVRTLVLEDSHSYL